MQPHTQQPTKYINPEQGYCNNLKPPTPATQAIQMSMVAIILDFFNAQFLFLDVCTSEYIIRTHPLLIIQVLYKPT